MANDISAQQYDDMIKYLKEIKQKLKNEPQNSIWFKKIDLLERDIQKNKQYDNLYKSLVKQFKSNYKNMNDFERKRLFDQIKIAKVEKENNSKPNLDDKLEQLIQDINESNQNQSSSCDQELNEISELKERGDHLKKHNEILSNRLELSENMRRKTIKENKSLKKQIIDMESKIEQKINEINKQLEQEYKKIESEKSNNKTNKLNKIINDQQKQLKKSKSRIEQLEDHIQSTNEKINNRPQSNLKNEKIIQKLKQKNNELEQTIQTLKIQNQKSKSPVTKISNISGCDELVQKNKELQQKIDFIIEGTRIPDSLIRIKQKFETVSNEDCSGMYMSITAEDNEEQLDDSDEFIYNDLVKLFGHQFQSRIDSDDLNDILMKKITNFCFIEIKESLTQSSLLEATNHIFRTAAPEFRKLLTSNKSAYNMKILTSEMYKKMQDYIAKRMYSFCLGSMDREDVKNKELNAVRNIIFQRANEQQIIQHIENIILLHIEIVSNQYGLEIVTPLKNEIYNDKIHKQADNQNSSLTLIKSYETPGLKITINDYGLIKAEVNTKTRTKGNARE